MNLIHNERSEAQGRGVVDPPLKRAMQEAARREKRRLLDAQRGKCRVRLGSHLDEWCALKDRLGFSLHSQLAKYLLDSYRTTTNPGTRVPKEITLISVSVPSLHHLALLCHQHGRNCNFPPTILAQPSSTEDSETPVLLWGCKDHQFHWDPHAYSAGLGGNSTEEDVTNLSSMQQNRTVGQENVPKKTAGERPIINMEKMESMQRSRIEPHSTCVQERLSGKQSSSYTSSKTCSDNTYIQPHQCNDGGRITECTSEEERHVNSGNKGQMKTNESKEQKETAVTDEVFCQSIQLELPVLSAPVEDSRLTVHQGVPVSEDIHKSICRDLAKKKPPTPSFSRTCRNQRTHNQYSQSYQQALMSEPKAALSCPFRRSPRGNKGCRAKTSQVSQFKVELTSSVVRVISDVKGQVEVLVGSAPNTDLSKRIGHDQESLPDDDTSRKTSSGILDGLAAVEEHTEPPPADSKNEKVEMSRSGGGDERRHTQPELHENEGQEPKSSQGREQKTSRRKSLIDEDLAQICKKRIRKSTSHELLMCEYDDCGKIFSKRQYLNYHQKYQHMNQRTFCCSVTECGKTFNFKKHLKEHEKRHSDRRDYICEFCARAFRSSSNLIIHRRIHTGEKPLQCEFCGFTCRQKASLNWHMKKHDADSFYNFPCDICGQRFEKRENLAAHKSRKHPAPRETGPQDISQCLTRSLDNACQADASCKTDQTKRLTKDLDPERSPRVPGGAKETLFPEYLDLTESVQEVPQTSETTEVSLVIVV